MINFKNITEALKNQLVAYNTENKAYVIVRNSPVNYDIDKAVQGWIGIYRDGVSYDPHASGNTWLVEIKIKVVMQAASASGSEDCEDKLDEIEEFVMNAVASDKRIGGYVHAVTGYEFNYFDFDVDDLEIYFQESELIISCEVLDR